MKKLRITLIVFALVLTLSVVYAVAGESFEFNFSGTLSNLGVEATQVGAAAYAGGANGGTWTANNDGGADITGVDLPVDEASITFTFKIVNSGDKAIKIENVVLSEASNEDSENVDLITIGGDYQSLKNQSIAAKSDVTNGESSLYTISITRNYDGTDGTKIFSFKLTIPYTVQ